MDVTDYEAVRERNIKEREAFFARYDNSDDLELSNALNILKELQPSNNNHARVSRSVKRKRNSDDAPLYFNVQAPLEIRRSSRIRNLPAEYNENDLPDEKTIIAWHNDNDIESLEDIVMRPKKTRRSSIRKPTPSAIVLSVEEITQEMIDNIAGRAGKKTYSSEDGTSCHQCRQKTTDTKTMCRSNRCIGVNGQFCGPCLLNRYGEKVADALKDPTWICPFCRGLCNCSFCRAKEGKRPTGVLTPLAVQKGFSSVHQFLVTLQGHGDRIQEPKPKENFYGFSKEKHTCISCRYKREVLERDPEFLGFTAEEQKAALKYFSTFKNEMF